MKSELRAYLMERGATLVGFGAVDEGLSPELGTLRRAVCVAVNRRLTEGSVDLMSALLKDTERWLRAEGHRFLVLPPDSDRVGGSFVSNLYAQFSHKTAATCAGLGWIGRSGLLINPEYGPRLSFGTVLTNAEFEPDQPVTTSSCGVCELCVKHCPAGAISGAEWTRAEPFPAQVDTKLCRAHQSAARQTERKPACGLCINICPYGRSKSNCEARIGRADRVNDTEDERCLNIR